METGEAGMVGRTGQHEVECVFAMQMRALKAALPLNQACPWAAPVQALPRSQTLRRHKASQHAVRSNQPGHPSAAAHRGS